MQTTRTRAAAAMAATVLISAAAASSAAAQPPPVLEDWKDAGKPRAPVQACRDLRSLTTYEYAIDAATIVPAKDPTPEFCLVQGLVAPEVRFEVSLPRAWNGRLYMFGNGGFAGEPFTAGGRVFRRNAALARGFAVVSTNTGHEAAREPGATFASSPQKLVDYAYRAVHISAVTAKEIARAYYGAAPARSYFDGCSTGGRQGLISAQRFPDDFDGIVVGAPVLDFSGTMLHYARVNQALRSAPALHEKMPLVVSKITAQCDAADGASDGLVSDPPACRFDPAADLPRCADGGASASCVTSDEIAAIRAVYSDVTVAGAVRFRGFPIGTEGGWDPWIARRDGQPPISRQFSDTFFKHMVTPGREIDWTTVDPEKNDEQMRTISTLLDATDPDLGRFRARGGKILMYYGWADPALNPLMGLDYYERVRQTMGPATPEFFRLFMLPGVFHCSGGPGPDRADFLTALIKWVEQRAVPDRLILSKLQDGKVVRTRPACPHPQVARHDGRGPIDDAASFTCAAPK